MENSKPVELHDILKVVTNILEKTEFTNNAKLFLETTIQRSIETYVMQEVVAELFEIHRMVAERDLQGICLTTEEVAERIKQHRQYKIR